MALLVMSVTAIITVSKAEMTKDLFLTFPVINPLVIGFASVLNMTFLFLPFCRNKSLAWEQ